MRIILWFFILLCITKLDAQLFFHNGIYKCDSNSKYSFINPWEFQLNDTLFNNNVNLALKSKFKKYYTIDSLVIIEYYIVTHGEQNLEEYYLLLERKNNEWIKHASYKLYFKKRFFNFKKLKLKLKPENSPYSIIIAKLLNFDLVACNCNNINIGTDLSLSGIAVFLVQSNFIKSCVIHY